MSRPPFPIGRKVVCIHDHFPAAVYEHFDAVPVAGQTYTISELVWATEYATGRMSLSLRLEELPPLEPRHGSFGLWRFRLIEDPPPASQLRPAELVTARPAAA